MNFEERYIVEILRRSGRVDAEPYDGMAEALGAYEDAQSSVRSGERVRLHRTSSVVLMSHVRPVGPEPSSKEG